MTRDNFFYFPNAAHAKAPGGGFGGAQVHGCGAGETQPTGSATQSTGSGTQSIR